jgi:hypothetical protein
MGQELSVPDHAENWTPEQQAKHEESRKRVAAEIMETERTYVNCLSVCLDVYFEPMRKLVGAPNQVVDANELQTLFSIMPILLQYHQGALVLVRLHVRIRFSHDQCRVLEGSRETHQEILKVYVHRRYLDQES